MFYPYIHKIHHSFIDPVAIGAEYAHPIEFLLGNVFPVNFGPLLLNKHIHFYTVMCWIFFRLGETLDCHSGYEFPWSPYRLIPFSVSAEYHDYHHTHNVGNYSTFFTIWDTAFNCNTSFYKFKDHEQNKKKTE
jgi:sterol desaturase/sphingolipid hydroxylase (fatty acid hydroxylase superfamily)